MHQTRRHEGPHTGPPAAEASQRHGAERQVRGAPSRRMRARRIVPISVLADRHRGVVVDGQLERTRHNVINTVLSNLRGMAPGGAIEALEWVAPRVDGLPGVTWKNVRDVALGEAMARFGRLGTSHGAWMLAARLRALAALLTRVADRLLIDFGWIRTQLQRGTSHIEINAELIARHTRILREEIGAIWKCLETHYYQGPNDDPQASPTRADFETNRPGGVREWDQKHPVQPLQSTSQPGFPRPEHGYPAVGVTSP